MKIALLSKSAFLFCALVLHAAALASPAGILELGKQPKRSLDLVRSLDDDRLALQARLDLVAGAKREITIQYYAIENDSLALASLAFLRDLAVNRGVRVRIIFDNYQLLLPRPMLAAVVRSYEGEQHPNFQIRVFNPFHPFRPFDSLTRRMHDKVITIDVADEREGRADDGRGILITGGRNASNGYFMRDGVDNEGQRQVQFEDMDVMVRGRIAPQQAKRYFNDLWRHSWVKLPDLYEFSYDGLNRWGCTGENASYCELEQSGRLHKEYFPAVATLDAALAGLKAGFRFHLADTEVMHIGRFTTDEWFSELNPHVERLATQFVFDPALVNGKSVDKDQFGTAKAIYDFVREATRANLTVVTPYLVTTPEQMALFRELRARGVSITMITNSDVSNDVKMAQAGFENSISGLLALGVRLRVYRGPETLHEKHFIVDVSSDKIADIANFELHAIPGIHELSGRGAYRKLRALAGDLRARGAFVGSFNWDFRSQNLNRETGLLIWNAAGGDGAAATSNVMERLVVKMAGMKMNSCEIDLARNNLHGCTYKIPADYPAIRASIDSYKAEPFYSLIKESL